uniref:uncharacterized protein LOC120329271 n=1 Tax=Styela clava TaxID=7725 RepID=UPI00193A9E10|nr:uncharacterized protein LOC120329271 [Styela clava]
MTVSIYGYHIDLIFVVLMVNITIHQIFIFIKKGLYKRKIQSLRDILKASNLPVIMNVTLILAGLFGIAAIMCVIGYDIVEIEKMHCNYVCTFNNTEIISEDEICERCNHKLPLISLNLSNSVFALYICFTTSIYMVLWFRQTMFSTEKTLKKLSPKCLKKFGYFQGLFIIISAIVVGIIWILLNLLYFDYILKLFLGIQLEIQIGLLTLFLIPLIKHQRSLKYLHQNQRPSDRLVRLMKRSIVAAIVAAITDIATLGILIRLDFHFLCVNILINMCCVLFCFTDWKTKFFPCIVLCIRDSEAAEPVPPNDNIHEETV